VSEPNPSDLVASLRRALATRPEDEATREQLARALNDDGRYVESEAVLDDGLTNLSAHDGPTLPCLCTRCLESGLVESEADGMTFSRCFVVARGRVLWYWAPVALRDDSGLRRDVRHRLDTRLASREAS